MRPKESKPDHYRDTCTPTFISTLPIPVKLRNQPWWSSTVVSGRMKLCHLQAIWWNYSSLCSEASQFPPRQVSGFSEVAICGRRKAHRKGNLEEDVKEK